MSELDYLKKVESDLRSKIEKARADSARRVQEARKSRDSIIGERHKDAGKAASALVDAALADAKVKADAMTADSDRLVKGFNSVRRGNFEAAVNLVLEELGV